MTDSNLLKNLRIASPCPVGWNSMSGDDKIRYCELCHLNVHNFSEMTAGEIQKLLTTSEGRICGRLYRRADGTVITRDCPVGLKAFRKRIARRAAAVLTAVLSLTTLSFSQSTKTSSTSRQYKLERRLAQTNQ